MAATSPDASPTSPRSSVNVHRSNTSRRPFLSIDPVEYSLTDGTAIPPPVEEEEQQRPDSSHGKGKTANGKPAALSLTSSHISPKANGPLSSHPVTPIEAPTGPEKGGFPFQRQGSNSFGSQKQNGHATRMDPPDGTSTPVRALTPNTSSPLSHHQHNDGKETGHQLSPPGSEKYHDQSSQPDKFMGRTRRPSFAERFLRFRSFSSLRSRNSSNTSFSQSHHVHNDGTQSHANTSHPANSNFGSLDSRGVKRPGSPNVAGLFRSSEQASNGSTTEPNPRVSQSFPRMMRKKSMELLGSARRKSGMWTGGGNTMNDMMTDEYEREKMREQDLDGKTEVDSMEGVRATGSAADGRQSKMSITRQESLKEPPPMLPELTSFKEMQGEDMFSNIGKDT